MVDIIAYYNFRKINDPEFFCDEHKEMCRSLDLKGRVYIAHEGINGTVSGASDSIDSYIRKLCSIEGFEDTDFKRHQHDNHVFADLRVKVRPEIVAFKKPIYHDPKTEGGRFLSPEEWRKIVESGEDYVMLDVRNEYEYKIGHFEGAVMMDVQNFYDSSEWLERQSINKDKKVLMYCTGGIRCEKFSVYMKEQGYRDVNQLKGGILRYAEKEGGKHYKGKCFVFDDRLAVEVDPTQQEPLTCCEITGVPCDTYINCANMECNKLFICSPEGAQLMKGCCSQECIHSPHTRPFKEEDLYIPFRRWYKYFDEGDKKQRIPKEAGA